MFGVKEKSWVLLWWRGGGGGEEILQLDVFLDDGAHVVIEVAVTFVEFEFDEIRWLAAGDLRLLDTSDVGAELARHGPLDRGVLCAVPRFVWLPLDAERVEAPLQLLLDLRQSLRRVNSEV